MFFDYHRVNSKGNTIRNYKLLLLKFCDQFGHRELESITSEEVLEVLFACPFFLCHKFSFQRESGESALFSIFHLERLIEKCNCVNAQIDMSSIE